MRRLLYVDCFAGAAGDMFLGALLDLGVPEEALWAELDKLALGEVSLRVRREARHGIEGTRVGVVVRGEEVREGPEADGDRKGHDHGHGHDHGRDHGHAHDHGHSHDHDHDHGHGHDRGHGHDDGHGHGRRYREIAALLAGAGLQARVGELAQRAFRLLGEAEARVHGVSLEEVHFHEVGAIDALVDVVGTCAGVVWLAPDEVVAAPVPLGAGMTRSAHGPIPLPAPAALGILAGVPVRGLAEDGETVTPTGAALLRALADRFGPMPPMRLGAVGYGVGGRDGPHRPNLLRLIQGEATEETRLERMVELAANIDDMNPQLYDHLLERLLAAGARDVWVTPVQMKKGRPGTVLGVLCSPDQREPLARLVLRESSTIGVRFHEVERRVLSRELRQVETPYGPVRVKIARDGEEVLNVAPEYDDCRAAASASGVPLKRVFQAVWRSLDLEGEER